MIISASRRTDIPAFYAEWFMNRVRAGYCCVPNPFDPNRVSRVSLDPRDVDVIVFWTRFPKPLLAHLRELDDRGLKSYFLYTITGYDTAVDGRCPSLDRAMAVFHELSSRIGPDRAIWRYDPIVLTTKTDYEFHVARFSQICSHLAGATRRVVISVVDPYRHTERRMRTLFEKGFEPLPATPDDSNFGQMMSAIAGSARDAGLEIQSCAEILDLRPFGILPGACIDPDAVQRVVGRLPASTKKDRSQRKQCRCIQSRDIGAYDTCSFGCTYCYATRNDDHVVSNRARHDPMSCVLVGSCGTCPTAGAVRHAAED